MLSHLFTRDCNIVLLQITQEVYVAEEWVNRAKNNARHEVDLRLDAEKALGPQRKRIKIWPPSWPPWKGIRIAPWPA